MNTRKYLLALGAVSVTLALTVSGTTISSAAKSPIAKARAGDECGRAGLLSPNRGVEGTSLKCMIVTTGTIKGTLHWWYPDLKPLKNIDWTIPANPGGYSLTSTAISESLKTEGLLTSYTSVFKAGAGGAVGLGAFQEIKAKPEALLITGIAMVGGLTSNKSTLKLTDSMPIAKMMREYDAVVVPANSKYRNLAQLMADIKSAPATVPIAGGNKGGIDHQIMGLLVKAAGGEVSKMNYVVYSGGTEVIASLLSGATKVGISGTSEFAAYVASGKLRVLGVSSAKKLANYKGATFKSQGFDLVYGNWRGVMAPADLSAADRLNLLKVIDAMHGTPTWKAVLVKNNWDDDFALGLDFKLFLDKEIPLVYGVIKDLGI